MYCIYSLPSTSRSSDLGNAATEEEQVGLLYFCNFFAVSYFFFYADSRDIVAKAISVGNPSKTT